MIKSSMLLPLGDCYMLVTFRSAFIIALFSFRVQKVFVGFSKVILMLNPYNFYILSKVLKVWAEVFQNMALEMSYVPSTFDSVLNKMEQ